MTPARLLELDFADEQSPEIMQSSPLMRLPPELRNYIFCMALAQDRKVYISLQKSRRSSLNEPHPGIALAMTCKQLHQETISLFLAHNRFGFRLRHDLGLPSPTTFQKDPTKQRYDNGLEDIQRWIMGLGSNSQHIQYLEIHFGSWSKEHEKNIGGILNQYKQLQRPGLKLALMYTFGARLWSPATRKLPPDLFEINLNQCTRDAAVSEIQQKLRTAEEDYIRPAALWRDPVVGPGIASVGMRVAMEEAESVIELLDVDSKWSWKG